MFRSWWDLLTFSLALGLCILVVVSTVMGLYALLLMLVPGSW